MKRLMTLAVLMLVMTATYAQKRTNYKFKFEYAMEIESQNETDCDIVFDVNDRPGETPVINMVSNTNGETNREELKPMIVYSADTDMICFTNTAGDTIYGISMHTDDNGKKSCILFVINVENGESKVEYGLTNETGSPNDEQCTMAYNALLKNGKAQSFNNFTVETLK